MPKDKHISLDDILEHDKGWNPGAIRGRYIGTIVGRRIGEDGYRKDCEGHKNNAMSGDKKR